MPDFLFYWFDLLVPASVLSFSVSTHFVQQIMQVRTFLLGNPAGDYKLSSRWPKYVAQTSRGLHVTIFSSGYVLRDTSSWGSKASETQVLYYF